MIGGKKAIVLVVALAFVSLALTGCLGTSEQSGGSSDVAVTINKATNWSSSNSYSIQPQEGNRYVLLEMTIKNNMKDELTMNPLYFKLDSSDGQVHTYSPWVNYSMPDGVQAGSTISATLGFEVAKTATPTELHFDNVFHQADATVPAVSGDTVSEQTSNSSNSNQTPTSQSTSNSGASTNTPMQGSGSSTSTPTPTPTPTPSTVIITPQCQKPWPSQIQLSMPSTASEDGQITITAHMMVQNYDAQCNPTQWWNAVNTQIDWKVVSPGGYDLSTMMGYSSLPASTLTSDPLGETSITFFIPSDYHPPLTALGPWAGTWTVYASFAGNPNYIQTMAIGHFTVPDPGPMYGM